MNEQFISSPHRHRANSVSKVMSTVCLALLPALLAYCFFFGWGIIIQCLMAIVFALSLEFLMLKLRRRSISLFLQDGSAIVTALLFALSISPFTPWWVSLSGIAFAIIFAKHIYGGLGNNLFNPAMAGYVFILLCFPAHMNSWPISMTGLTDYLAHIFSDSSQLDGISGATALANMKTQLGQMNMISEIRRDPVYGHFGGAGWEWISAAYLCGGLILLLNGIIKWQTPVAMLGSMFVISMLFNFYDSEIYASPLFHLCTGGSLLCAFFIATDPVSAATTPRGRLVYGAMIGLIAYFIRVYGAYPDGIAFAVLIANAAVPLIDYLMPPRVLGENRK